ncbi:MAG: low temperature requirement protein A [Solirubrobacterales bacterium]|nr:low temperature requirement protein A [Solirubrobacterales bacterium]
MSRFQLRKNTDEEYRVSTLELFYDLVFVFAVTQVTHLLLEHLTWLGALQSLIVVLVVWWAWQFTTWATNELDPDAIPIRLMLIAIMLGSLLMSVAIPEAFGDKGLLFAAAYVAIQVGRQSFMTFVTAEAGSNERNRALHILIWFLFAAVFWIVGGLAEGDTRIVLWLVALAIDYGGPLVTYKVPFLQRQVTMDAWNIGGGHFAERFQLFTIIALGETVVLTGATTAGLELDFPTVATFVAAFLSTVCLWWLYFNFVSDVFERLLVNAENRTKMARDLYTFGHIPIIAGIILCAVGDELMIAHPGHYLETPALIAVISGPVLYLMSFAPIRWRMSGGLPAKRTAGAAACVAVGLVAAGTHMPALTVGVLLAAILISVVTWETLAPSRPYEPEDDPLLRSGAEATSQ